MRVGFEPTPFRTSALSWRLRPLGHLTFFDQYRTPLRFNTTIHCLHPVKQGLHIARQASTAKTFFVLQRSLMRLRRIFHLETRKKIGKNFGYAIKK